MSRLKLALCSTLLGVLLLGLAPTASAGTVNTYGPLGPPKPSIVPWQYQRNGKWPGKYYLPPQRPGDRARRPILPPRKVYAPDAPPVG